MTRNELVAYCQSQGIVLEAWAPLVRGQRFRHPDIVRLAEKYKKTPAQILIRYGLDRVRRPCGASWPVQTATSMCSLFATLQGFVVIPKSVKKERIVDNANVFDFALDKEDIDHLTTLDEFLITVSTAVLKSALIVCSRSLMLLSQDWEVSTVA